MKMNLFALLILAASSMSATAANFISVTRISYLGSDSESGPNGTVQNYDRILQEDGALYCRGRFIPSASNENSILLSDERGSYPDGAAQAAELKAVDGLYIMRLSDYEALKGRCFQRSEKTFTFLRSLVRDVPYVAVANSPNGLIEPTPVIHIAAGSYAVAEGGPAIDVLITLSKPASRDVVARLQVGGTARNGKDYGRIKKRAKILAGNISTVVSIAPRLDNRVEGPETVTLNLRPSTRYAIATSGPTTVTISD